MNLELNKLIIDALEDLKGQKIVELDVHQLTDIMDHLIIATGTSNRHVKSLADNVVEELKKANHRPLGIEGLELGEWVLIDYGDTVVHIMLQATRDFYELEKLWSKVPAHRAEDRQ
ncbi:ribosome silencing factor [Saccharophagus sp. K07]|jgi:ribosome-associated protein|uniref:ribosome silencing factor n=1 Tax=Saccharophagus sp. K07 TaxID=2283636 RepID=UPI001652226A|nr:ribosome silencing factor [Saccharophagus sp. K07]MBC6904448.1 ribosome silencing factor [Saccharophagus sp. K07]